MNLGTDNRKQTIAAVVLGLVLFGVVGYEAMTSFTTNASSVSATDPASTAEPVMLKAQHSPRRGLAAANLSASHKSRPTENLDPTLHLKELEATEQIKYEGSGRNIFVAEADSEIPKPIATGAAEKGSAAGGIYTPPPVPAAAPIPLKFFGFASNPGEPKKIFLSKGDDVFIAGEGEIVDRRYKVVRISPNSVEMQDVVGSGAPQTIPLTQG